MAMWKRKKCEVMQEQQPAEELSRLAACPLEQFANGASALCYMFSFGGLSVWLQLFGVETVASIQSVVALAALRSGATGVELASLGNFGRQPQHIAQQIKLKYCKASSYHLPSPHLAAAPVLVKSNAVKSNAHGSWSDHDMNDPKFINNPLSKGGFDTLPPHGCAWRWWFFSKE